MNAMLAEVLVEVKGLSREVQFIKNQLAEGLPGSPTTPVLPIQLPITTYEDFLQAETLLKDQTVRKQMVSCLSD